MCIAQSTGLAKDMAEALQADLNFWGKPTVGPPGEPMMSLSVPSGWVTKVGDMDESGRFLARTALLSWGQCTRALGQPSLTR